MASNIAHVPGPLPAAARFATFEADGYQCAVCGLGPAKEGVQLGIGTFSSEPARWRAMCWACLLSTGVPVIQLRYQLPPKSLKGNFRRPYPTDHIVSILEAGPASKRDLQRKTHLSSVDLEAAISTLVHNGTVEVQVSKQNRLSMTLSLSPKTSVSPKKAARPAP